ALKLARKNENDSLRQAGMNEQQANDWLNKKYEPLEKDLQPPLSLVLDHIDHIVQLIGVDHVGLGSDFDGISSSPKQLEEVSDFPNLSKALLERGYTARDVKKILGGNFIRVFKANRL
ncbi:MAG TPA: membrane dipeptidase, partial [Chitinophagaceae bacterium]|nr:membrane dipeptidase [Chitinophagaceae bacterium]